MIDFNPFLMSIDLNIEVSSPAEEVSLFRKNLSGIIDAAIVLIAFVSIASLFPLDQLSEFRMPFLPELFILLTLAVYRLLGFLFFDCTVGMRICGMRILSNDSETLSFTDKVFAAFFILVSGVAYYRRA